MPQINSTDLNKLVSETEKAVRDGAYVVVGLGVLSFQRAQVRRRELVKRLQADRSSFGAQLNETARSLGEQLGSVSTLARTVDERVAPVREQLGELAKTVDERVAPLRGQLSEQLDELAKTVDERVAPVREQLGELAKTVDERVAPTRAQFDQQVDALEERLPSSARNVFSSVRSAVAAPEAALRSAVGLD